jgi:hypothetical protein
MVKNFLLTLVLLCAASVASLSQAQALSAFVDRTNITMNDVITLTLRLDVSLGNSRPQMTGLNQNFEQVGGLSSRSTYTNTNGNIQSWTEYSLMLRPLSTGTLTIPAFHVNNESTTPIQITVSDAAVGANDNDDIFLRTTISKTESYVQEQLLFTIKIYYSIGFDQGAQLSAPNVENAVVQQLGSDNNYQEVLNGISYNVTERRFVMFPQQSGEFKIPPISFNATVGRRGGINRLFTNRSAVREINLLSDNHSVNVLSHPTEFDGNTWLPAASLELTENWSGDLNNLHVGEALTRNVTITTTGLSSSLLPAVEYAPIPGLRFYPDQPVREDKANTDGVIGKRSDGTAIVASQAGDFLLPEVKLAWWNTSANRLELATLPAKTLHILPPIEAPDAKSISPEAAAATAPVLPGASAGETRIVSNPIWIITTVIFAALWAVTAYLLVRSRQHLMYVETTGVPQPQVRIPVTNKSEKVEPATLPDASAALRVLKTACDSNVVGDVRKALLKWGQAALQNPELLTLSQLSSACGDAVLTQALRGVDQVLYGNSSHNNVDCKALYERVAQLHKLGFSTERNGAKYGLRPLYQ